MNPISGGNNAENAAQPKLTDRLYNLDVSNTDYLANELAGIDRDVNQEARAVFDENSEGGAGVTNGECAALGVIASGLANLFWRLREAMTNATGELKDLYKSYMTKVSSLREMVTNAASGENPNTPYSQDEREEMYCQYLDKKADEKLAPAVQKSKSLNASARAYAMNPYLVSSDIHINNDVIEEIKNLYMDNVIVSGSVKRTFTSKIKAQHLVSWASEQLSFNNIDRTNYSDLTSEALAYLNSNSSVEEIPSDDNDSADLATVIDDDSEVSEIEPQGTTSGFTKEQIDAVLAQIHEETPVHDPNHIYK